MRLDQGMETAHSLPYATDAYDPQVVCSSTPPPADKVLVAKRQSEKIAWCEQETYAVSGMQEMQ